MLIACREDQCQQAQQIGLRGEGKRLAAGFACECEYSDPPQKRACPVSGEISKWNELRGTGTGDTCGGGVGA